MAQLYAVKSFETNACFYKAFYSEKFTF